MSRRYTEYLARVGERSNPDSHHYVVPPSHVVRWGGRWTDVFSR